MVTIDEYGYGLYNGAVRGRFGEVISRIDHEEGR